MSRTRAERLERLKAIKTRQREIEEMRLAALNAKAAELAAEAEALLLSLGDHSPLTGLFLEAKAQRLRRKEAERAAVLVEAAAAQARLQEAGAGEKRLERIAREARGREDAATEAGKLAEILDTFLGSKRASFE